jgi:hypothetical protein
MTGRRRRAPGTGRTPPSRVSRDKVLTELRLAARKGDRAALELALAQMRTLAHSPRYWEKYLGLLRNPLARLVDLLAIKQGDHIAHLKGWKLPKPAPPESPKKARKPGTGDGARRRRRLPDGARQPSLFDPA